MKRSNLLKSFDKCNSSYEKLELWFKKTKENEKYKYFLEFLPKHNLKDRGEYLINLFKLDQLKNLEETFKDKLKKSIDESGFIKNSIKRFKEILNKSSDRNRSMSFSRTKKHNDVYQDLIDGKREDYYIDYEMLKIAGETEAIFDFISYLENFSKKKARTIVKVDNSSLELIPVDIFENTRNYLKKNAIQVNTCYKHKAYDACAILLRKITEILIIEIYEKEEIEHKIKDSDGNYLMLKGLINCFINERKFKNVLSRNMTEILPKIKRNGDLSAHNRKYNSRKHDIDKLSDDFRLFFEEMVNSIHY